MAGSGAFPKVAGDTIFANDYNTLYNSLAAIIGVGSGTSGYGDTLTSSNVTAGNSVGAAKWTELKTDILKARRHQLGTTAYNTLVNTTLAPLTTKLTTNGTIEIADINVLKTTIDAAVAAKDTVDGGQLLLVTGASRTYTAAWNGALAQATTVTFASADAARNFFNAGGYLSTVSTGNNTGNGSSKDNRWETLLEDVSGTVYEAADYRSGTANVVIRSETYAGGAYSDSYIKIWGERVSATTIKITTLFDDASIITGLLGSSGSGQVYDELITVDVTSGVDYFKSFDAVVSPVPTSVTAAVFSVPRSDPQTAGQAPGFGGGGGPIGSYSIGVNTTTISETGTLQFTFIQSGYTPGARTCYYEPAFTSTAGSADFQQGGGNSALSGFVTFSTPTDALPITFFMNTDTLTEGTEFIQMKLFTNSSKTELLAQSQQVTITDSSTSVPVGGEAITGLAATFTIGATISYTLSGPAGTTVDYVWTFTRPDGTTGALGSVTRIGLSGTIGGGTGTYSTSGAFLTGPGAFLLSATFNATNVTKSALTTSQVPATLTYTGISSQGEHQVRLSVTSNYGYTHSYTSVLTGGATFNESSGNLPNSSLTGAATGPIMNIAVPHGATTMTTTVTMPYCNPAVVTASVPSNTEVLTMSPTTVNDGEALPITVSGGANGDFYDYYYQSSLTYSPSDPGYAYRSIGNVPPYTGSSATDVPRGWGGLISGWQTNAFLSSTGTRSLPTHGIGLLPATYRLWVRFGQNQHLRFKNFVVNQTNGITTTLGVSGTLTAGGLGVIPAYSNGSGAGDTSAGLNVTLAGLLANELVDWTVRDANADLTTTFFTNHSTWVNKAVPLNNGTASTQSYSLSKGQLYLAGASVYGYYVLWVYFINSGQYRGFTFRIA